LRCSTQIGSLCRLHLPGPPSVKFVTEKGEWIASDVYPTVLRGGVQNNAIAVPSTFQQVVQCAWWFGELIASSFKALVNAYMDAAVASLLSKVIWKSVALYCAEILSQLVWTYWVQAYAVVVFTTLSTAYLLILLAYQLVDFYTWIRAKL